MIKMTVRPVHIIDPRSVDDLPEASMDCYVARPERRCRAVDLERRSN